MRSLPLALALLLLIPALAVAQADSSHPGPPDRPVGAQAHQLACIDSLLAPRIAKGQASYPAVKTRFLAGLPPGHRLFVSVNLFDPAQRKELVFIRVDRMGHDTLYGVLINDLQVVRGFPRGTSMAVLDEALLDWTIARPDGTEEGNAVGNYIDSLQGRFPC